MVLVAMVRRVEGFCGFMYISIYRRAVQFQKMRVMKCVITNNKDFALVPCGFNSKEKI